MVLVKVTSEFTSKRGFNKTVKDVIGLLKAKKLVLYGFVKCFWTLRDDMEQENGARYWT